MAQDYDRRFSALSRLYGSDALEKLAQSHVVVAGIGGVGSWAVEALARSGVGKITMIDLDIIAESNINRQIHALSSTLGMGKGEAMRERIGLINEQCEVVIYDQFLTTDNLDQFDFGDRHSTWILDAIDEVKVKAALIAFAKYRRYKIISTGAAGGKSDAQQLMIDDISATYHDPLAARLRATLRKEHNFPPAPKKFKIPIVFSSENSLPNQQGRTNSGLQCGGYGSIVTITATMGLLATSYIINKIIQ